MDRGLISLFVHAGCNTAILAVCAAFGGLAWGGLLFFIASTFGNGANRAVGAYVQLLRNIPVLLPIYLIYFGFPLIGLFWPAGACGVVALIMQQGAYVAEILRGSAMAIDRTQHDAALSIGLSNWLRFRKIILPQIMVYSLPALGNQAVLLLKDTSLLSAISVVELMMQARLLVESTGSLYFPFSIATALYLFLVLLIDVGFAALSNTVKWR